MPDFDDATDPKLGAACSRLSACVLSIPEGAVIDEASGLTEADLVLILRKLYHSRKMVPIEVLSMDELGRKHGGG